MTALTYLDFDLSIEATNSEPTRYRVRSFSQAAGTANGEFTLPFSQQDLEILFLRLGRPRRGVRAIGSAEMQAAQGFGNTLFRHVFAGQVQSGLQRSLDSARQQGQGMRIRLRLSDAPALADLPWEFLYDPTQSHFLAYSTLTPLVRYLDLPNTVAPLAVQPPLKVLVMIANPRDHSYSTLNVEEEWRKVQGALAELETRGLVQVTRLEAATLSALQRQLRRDQYHIFHFVGHGGFDNQTQSGVLLLEDEGGRSRLVNGHYLGALLRDHFSLRLALLNACEGARTSRADPFAGVAQHLVQQGIPAVIAMQFEITDQAAIALAHEFYSALADNYGVDAALSEARKALYAAGNDIEWGTPVLYMRALSGQLFALAVDQAMPAPQSPPAVNLAARSPNLADAPANAPPKSDTAPAEPLPQPVQAAPQERKRVDAAPASNIRPVQHDETAPPAAATPATQPTQTPSDSTRERRPRTKKAVSPAVNQTLPEFDWVTIPAGEFWMGSRKEQKSGFFDRLFGQSASGQAASSATPADPNAYANELPQHRLALPAYRIARTPVTNAQFQPFVAANGYTTQAFWSATGWQWRTQNGITEPRYWQDGTWNGAKQPVVGVSWYEVLAYSQWLAQLTGEAIRLPTEAEWEKAARGTDGRLYPWGISRRTANFAILTIR